MSATSSHIGSNVTLPGASSRRLAADERHPPSVRPDPRQDPARHDATAQPLVERSVVCRRPWADNATPPSSRHDVRDQHRLRRPRSRRRDRRRSHEVIRARRRSRRRGLRRASPLGASRSGCRRRDQGATIRCPDDDAVHAGRRARSVGSRRDRALRARPRLVRHGVRGVQRLVQRQDEPGPPVLAQPRPRRHPILRPAGRSDRRRRRHPGGLLAGAHLVRILGRRRHLRRRRLLLLYGSGTRRVARPTATCRRMDRVRRPAHSPSSRTRPSEGRGTRERRCSRSARRRTRQERALQGGTPPASSRAGAPLLANDNNSKRAPPPISDDPARDVSP